MSTIHQPCPECSQVLELPGEAVGRLAQCPACDAKFRIAAESPKDDSETPPETPKSDDVESDTDVADSSHPTAASSDPPEGTPAIVSRSIEEILPLAWQIFKHRWNQSILSCVIVAAIVAVAVGLPALGLRWLAVRSTMLAVLGIAITVPYVIWVSACSLVGLCRVHLAIARNEPSPINELRPNSKLIIRFLPSYILLMCGLMLLVGVGVGVVAAAAMSGSTELANVLGVVMTFVITTLGTIIQWYLWSWMMAASDGKTTPMGSLSVATQITSQNRLCSFYIVIVAVVLSLLGSLACYVGHFVSIPITLLLFAVGYLKCSNQVVVDPIEYDLPDRKRAPTFAPPKPAESAETDT